MSGPPGGGGASGRGGLSRRRDLLGLAAGSVALPAATARAQAAAAEFPTGPVAMVVAFPPGGQADVVARPVAAALERHWRQPVPVVNRPGAAGEVGNASVARAAPDGYTLLLALSSLAVLPEAARPGAISYSSSGNYSALHVPMAMLTSDAGIGLLHVPFQGGAPALTALLGGQVQALASGPGPAAPHIREGRLRALACWGARRLAEFPEVPTLIERGYPEAEFYIWAGVFAPAGTPPALRERLREGMAAAAGDPEVRRALAASGNTLDHRDGEGFERFLSADAARLRVAGQRIGRVE